MRREGTHPWKDALAMATAHNVRNLWDYLRQNHEGPLAREDLRKALNCTDAQLNEAIETLVKVLDRRIEEEKKTSLRWSIPIAKREAPKEIRRMIAYG